MNKIRASHWTITALSAVAACLCTSAALAASQWIPLGPQPGDAGPPTLVVESQDASGLTVAVQLPGLELDSRLEKAGEFTTIDWPQSNRYGEVGEPMLPVIRKIIIVPHGATVSLDIQMGKARTIDLAKSGLPTNVQPMQAPVEKIPGARENAPFAVHADAYAVDAFSPGERATVTMLGVMRGHQLAALEIHPVAYNPAKGQLRTWSNLTVDVAFNGGKAYRGTVKPLPAAKDVILNPPKIAPIRGGNYLIVAAQTYADELDAFIAAKQGAGFDVSLYSVPAGTSATAIKSHIQSLWGTADAPDYILLVGDTDTIPHWTGGGDGSPDTDIQYACMDGSTDWHPDIAIGRFSVRSSAELAAVIEKTLLVCSCDFPDPEYTLRAVFMASTDNHTISEGTHEYVIGTHLDGLGFASDRLYSYYGATTQQVRDCFNDGRIYGIYSGHGGTTSWADGPVFTQSDVRNLTNNGLYPLVCSFACVTGSYAMTECFTETWHRVEDKGAVTIYGSSVNSYWTEDDWLERDLFDAIYYDGITEVSPAWQAAFVRYLTHGGDTGTTRRYYEMYNLMGDPSLPLPEPGGGHDMKVSPFGGMSASGQAGGPFSPNSCEFTVENASDAAMNVEIACDAAWVTVDPMSMLIPAGGNADVVASINDAAMNLGDGGYEAVISFANTTTHDGDTTRVVSLDIGVPVPIIEFDFDTNPGWTTTGDWAFGVPQGVGGDPTSGHTGSNVYGFNLAGEYVDNMPEYHLTSTPIDCSDLTDVQVSFWRWLGVERNWYDHAYFRVSNDGSNWITLWENGEDSMQDTSWTEQMFDIADIADGESSVYLRWTMGTTDYSVTYSGWNVDDVSILGIAPGEAACIEDLTDDGVVNADDLFGLLGAWGQFGARADLNIDGVVNADDLFQLLGAWGDCP